MPVLHRYPKWRDSWRGKSIEAVHDTGDSGWRGAVMRVDAAVQAMLYALVAT